MSIQYNVETRTISVHVGIPVLPIYKTVCVALALSKIISTSSNADKLITFKYHFCLLKMELYQSGADSYLIQIFKSMPFLQP